MILSIGRITVIVKSAWSVPVTNGMPTARPSVIEALIVTYPPLDTVRILPFKLAPVFSALTILHVIFLLVA